MVLLEHSHVDLFIYYLWIFCITMAELSGYSRDHMFYKALNTYSIWPFAEGLLNPTSTLLQQIKLMSLVIQRVTLKCQESRMKSPRTR